MPSGNLTQGLVHGPVSAVRKLTERVACTGRETGLEKCAVEYSRAGNTDSGCKLNENVVSITCVHDSLAVCEPGEVPWKGFCYSVNFNRSSFAEAQVACRHGCQMAIARVLDCVCLALRP